MSTHKSVFKKLHSVSKQDSQSLGNSRYKENRIQINVQSVYFGKTGLKASIMLFHVQYSV